MDRVLAAVIAAGVVGAALATLAADRVAGPDGGAEPSRERSGAPSPAQAAAALQGSAQEGTIRAASWQAPKQARVPAGVLVRAASRRAQERDLPICRAPERRRGREMEDVILSVEIDWHAGGAAER
jgi:hypothetical protein